MASLFRVQHFALLLTAWTSIGLAQTFGQTDPTRPAPEWLAAQARVPASELAEHDSASAGVRVIVLGATRKFAIIDGQLIRVGQTYHGVKLVRIRPEGVVLHKDGGEELLNMSPAVTKKVHVPRPSAGRVPSRNKTANGESQ